MIYLAFGGIYDKNKTSVHVISKVCPYFVSLCLEQRKNAPLWRKRIIGNVSNFTLYV